MFPNQTVKRERNSSAGKSRKEPFLNIHVSKRLTEGFSWEIAVYPSRWADQPAFRRVPGAGFSPWSRFQSLVCLPAWSPLSEHIISNTSYVLFYIACHLHSIFLSNHSSHAGRVLEPIYTCKESSQLEDRTLLKVCPTTSTHFQFQPGLEQPHPHQVVFLTKQAKYQQIQVWRIRCVACWEQWNQSPDNSCVRTHPAETCSEAASCLPQIWPVSTTTWKYQIKHKLTWKLF